AASLSSRNGTDWASSAFCAGPSTSRESSGCRAPGAPVRCPAHARSEGSLWMVTGKDVRHRLILRKDEAPSEPHALGSDVASPSLSPELSVVVASVSGWEVLEPTLGALDAQPERDRMEVIVVETLGGGVRARLRSRWPGVVMIESEREAIPRLRYRGVCRAR